MLEARSIELFLRTILRGTMLCYQRAVGLGIGWNVSSWGPLSQETYHISLLCNSVRLKNCTRFCIGTNEGFSGFVMSFLRYTIPSGGTNAKTSFPTAICYHPHMRVSSARLPIQNTRHLWLLHTLSKTRRKLSHCWTASDPGFWPRRSLMLARSIAIQSILLRYVIQSLFPSAYNSRSK